MNTISRYHNFLLAHPLCCDCAAPQLTDFQTGNSDGKAGGDAANSRLIQLRNLLSSGKENTNSNCNFCIPFSSCVVTSHFFCLLFWVLLGLWSYLARSYRLDWEIEAEGGKKGQKKKWENIQQSNYKS